MLLKQWMLRGDTRQYVIDKVKAPLMKAILSLAKRIPEPTEENTINPNSHILMEIRDKFLEYEENPSHPDKKNHPLDGRDHLFKGAFDLLIAEYEHDPYYRYRFDWFLEELVEMVIGGYWRPRPPEHPLTHWSEPKRNGCWDRDFKEFVKPYVPEGKRRVL